MMNMNSILKKFKYKQPVKKTTGLPNNFIVKESDSPEVTLSRLKLKGLNRRQAALWSFTIRTHTTG